MGATRPQPELEPATAARSDSSHVSHRLHRRTDPRTRTRRLPPLSDMFVFSRFPHCGSGQCALRDRGGGGGNQPAFGAVMRKCHKCTCTCPEKLRSDMKPRTQTVRSQKLTVRSCIFCDVEAGDTAMHHIGSTGASTTLSRLFGCPETLLIYHYYTPLGCRRSSPRPLARVRESVLPWMTSKIPLTGHLHLTQVFLRARFSGEGPHKALKKCHKYVF